jgi:hypothetical protein
MMNAEPQQLPACPATLAPEPAAASTASRVVAGLMQLKDTFNILLLLTNGTLLVGIMMGVGVPGLVLYGLRWRQVWGRAGRGATAVQALLSMAHEIFWMRIFYGERTATEPLEHHEILTNLYALGALLTALQLVATVIGLLLPGQKSERLCVEQPAE